MTSTSTQSDAKTSLVTVYLMYFSLLLTKHPYWIIFLFAQVYQKIVEYTFILDIMISIQAGTKIGHIKIYSNHATLFSF